MVHSIITKTGKEIECAFVGKSGMWGGLVIDVLAPINEAALIFSDPNETEVLTEKIDMGVGPVKETVYEGYTTLMSVSPKDTGAVRVLILKR